MLKPVSSNPRTGCHSPRCYLNTSCYITSELAVAPAPTLHTHARVVKETSSMWDSMHPGLEVRLSAGGGGGKTHSPR